MKKNPPRRRASLFPKTVGDLVTQAIQPMMSTQGKLYGALMRDWHAIVGPERAAISKPQRLQFSGSEKNDATLHLQVRPAAAPELAYACEQMLEQCARYFGYRAITRIVLHPTHAMFDNADAREDTLPQTTDIASANSAFVPQGIPEMDAILQRIATRVGSTIVKKNINE